MTGTREGAFGLDEARRLYAEGAMPVRAIAERLGLSASAFRRLRAERGWPPRRRSGPGAKASARRGRAPRLEGLVARLRRQIGRRLTELEAAEAAASATEYAALLKALAELARLETRAGPAPSAGEGAHGGHPDPDALREAVARRVEGFGAGRHAADVPGDAAGA